ncbi:MAG: hypothetical protein L0Y39_12895 [Methylococcaceae bacterium]|nr:hypothetical protein [Methylococcaceae bacterium]
MAIDVDPIVGNWYQRTDNDQEFEVVAFNEDEGIVEIQHSDGELETLDIAAWHALELESIESPDDYSIALDDSDLDELEYEESEMDDDEDKEDWDES